MHGAFQELRPGLQILRLFDDLRQPFADEARALHGMGVARRVVPLRVHRLRAVRKRVHRRPDRLLARKRQRELGLVDRTAQMRSRAAALHPALGIADAEVGRPLCARVRRRDGNERKLGFGGDRLAEVDRAAAAERDDACFAAASIRSDGTSLQRATGRIPSRVSCQRSLATSSGLPMRSSARTPGSSRRPQRTITRAPAHVRRRRRRARRASRCARSPVRGRSPAPD